VSRRILVLVAVVVAAVAVVGLSAAATMSARDQAPKAAKPKPVQETAGVPTSGGAAQSQSPEGLALYWSRERMQSAKPAQKSVVGATRPSATLPPAPGQTAPSRSAPQPKVAPKTSPQQKSAAPSGGPAGQTSDSGSAADHWTQDDMDKASPVEKSPSGDAGGGSSGGLPGSGGSTTPPPAVP